MNTHEQDLYLPRSFSILGRIEGGEAPQRAAQEMFRQTFSILGRIEGGEAEALVTGGSHAGAFQYPRPDRRG